jgi:hypothetical protein
MEGAGRWHCDRGVRAVMLFTSGRLSMGFRGATMNSIYFRIMIMGFVIAPIISCAPKSYSGAVTRDITSTAERGNPGQDRGARVPEARDDIKGWLMSLPHAARNSGAQVTVNAAARPAARALIKSVLDDGAGKAGGIAAESGFLVSAARVEGKEMVILHEYPLIGHHAVAIINPDAERDLVVEVPHPSFEPGTLEEGYDLFARSGGRALIVAGADRCASKVPSGCDGKTSVCGDDHGSVAAAYVNSDVAHDVVNIFHFMHEEMGARWPKSRFVQLHGMRSGSAWVILSDGARHYSRVTSHWSNQVRDAIRAKISGKSDKVTSCQSVEDSELYEFRRLCGLENVQGRSLNHSSNACSSGTENASGRFLHVEQSWEVLGDVTQRDKVIAAIKESLPALSSRRGL